MGHSGYAVIRLAAGILLVSFWGLAVNGALLAGTIGTGVVIIICYFVLRDIFISKEIVLAKSFYQEMIRYAFPVLIAITMVKLIMTLDMVMVRHYCTEDDSGFYATASIIGRLAFSLPAVLVIVLFPEVSKHSGKSSENKHLWITLGLTAIIGGGITIVYVIWPEWIIMILFGRKYLAGSPFLQIIGANMALLATANVFFTYYLANLNYKFLIPLIGGVFLMVGLTLIYHENALMIAKIQMISVVCVSIGSLAIFVTDNSKKSRCKKATIY